ncbi:MAG: polysaccharide lyase family 8 super-sandwich domain-containing protein [Eubacteriales bacterium]
MSSLYHVLTNGENPVIPATVYHVDPAKLTAQSFKAVKDRWREMLVGNPRLNAEDPRARRRAERAGQRAAEWLAQIITAPDTTTLFDGLVYTKPEELNKAYDRLYEMTLGWATFGSQLYHDSSVLEAVRFALQWLYSYDIHRGKTFAEARAAGGDLTWASSHVPDDAVLPAGIYGANVRMLREGNWWHWFIGIPIPLTQTLLLLEDVLPSDFIRQILEPVDYLLPTPTRKGSGLVSQGKACLLSALLQEQAERCTTSVAKMFEVFEYVDELDGFYVDGSFVQHRKLAYVGGYGLSYVDKFFSTLYALAHTDFDYGGMLSRGVNQMFTQFFDAFEPFIYRGTMMAATTGRNHTSREQVHLIANLFHLADAASPELRRRFYATVRYYEEHNPAFSELQTAMSYAALPQYDDYLAAGVPARTGYELTRIYGMMDRVVQHTKDYAVVLSISSTRHYRYEAIIGQNGTGWYMGDGVTHVYGSDREAYENSAFRFMDRMRMPGVTMTTAPRTQQQFCVYTNPLNGDPFVGGVSDGVFDSDADVLPGGGKYGVGVMKLVYRRDMNLIDFSSDLLAQKAWFMFDREVVCTGSNITATNSAEIITVVDNRRLRDDSEVRLNGKPYTPGETVDPQPGVRYLTLSRFGGYCFPDSPTLVLREQTNTNRYLQLWLSHGENPAADRYAYILLPEMAAEGVAAYAASPEIEILRNDEKITAVKKASLGKTGYVFWAQDEDFFDGLRASCPCTVMKTEHAGGRVTFHLSDPSQEQTQVVLTVRGNYRVVAAGKRVSAANRDGLTVLTVDTTRAFGATLGVTLAPADNK